MVYLFILIMLLLSLIFFLKTLGIRRLVLHPATYFFLIWIVSVLSEWLFDSMNLVPIVDRRYINELLLYVGFTAFCFVCVLYCDKKNINNINVSFDKFIGNISVFKILTVLYLVSIVADFIINGRSLNMAENRAVMGESNNMAILKIIQSFGFLLQIISGYLFAERYLNKRDYSISYFWIILPMVVGLFSGVLIGGRNPIILMMKNVLVGIGFSILYLKSKTQIRKFIIGGVLLLLVFSMFSTFVDDQRGDLANRSSFSENFDNDILKSVSGLMHYTTAHYVGYQYRRIDYVDENNLLYGAATFYGLGNFKMPLFPLSFNIWKLFTDYTPKELYFELQYDYYYTTNSIYLSLMKDFGRFGMLFVIFLLVVITQRTYSALLAYRGENLLTLFLYLLLFSYWSSSNFDSSFAGPVYMTIFLPLLLYNCLKKCR